MKADVIYYNITLVGSEGKTLSEILDKACERLVLNKLGRSKLRYKIINK